jgi:hypothetical protein
MTNIKRISSKEKGMAPIAPIDEAENNPFLEKKDNLNSNNSEEDVLENKSCTLRVTFCSSVIDKRSPLRLLTSKELKDQSQSIILINGKAYTDERKNRNSRKYKKIELNDNYYTFEKRPSIVMNFLSYFACRSKSKEIL